jgi:hypothetical protein
MQQSVEPYIPSNHWWTTWLHQKPIVCDTTYLCSPRYRQELGQEHSTQLTMTFSLTTTKIIWSEWKLVELVHRLLAWPRTESRCTWCSLWLGDCNVWRSSRKFTWSYTFRIFINDFPKVVFDTSQTALYADDSKLYKSLSCLGSCESLQQSLNRLDMWSHNNNISFNASKVEVLTVTRKSNPLCFYYHLGDTTLAHARKEKDLGCIITNHLTWDQYILT